MKLKKITVFLFFIFLSINLICQNITIEEDMRVLLLFSGSHEYLVNRETYIALEKELQKSDIRLFSEYLGDNNSVFYRDKDTFIKFFAEKYGRNNLFDLVIAYNTKSIDFCEEYGQLIFPNTKILNLNMFRGSPIEETLVKEIELISDLHPQLEHLLVVTDKSHKGQTMKNYLQTYLDSTKILKEKVLYIDFSKISYSEISKYEYYSQKNSIVLLLSGYLDTNLSHKNYHEQIVFISESLNLPIYTFYEKSESIALGGYYANLDEYAENLSVKIMLILNNLPIKELDFSDIEKFDIYLNNKIAHKNKINIENYRDKALILEEDTPLTSIMIRILRIVFYATYLVILVLLVISHVKKKSYKKELIRSQKILTEISEKTYHYIVVVAKETGIIVDYNQRVAKSEFGDEMIKNTSSIYDFFSENLRQLIKINTDSSQEKHDLEFSSRNISFPARVTIMNYSDNQKEFAIVEFEDNSKIKHLIMELNKKLEDYEKKVFESKNLMEGLIREIRDPLNVRNGFKELLANEDYSEVQKKEYLSIIDSNSEKLLKLVEKVLVFSELNRNIRVLNNQGFSVNSCIRTLINEIQKDAIKQGKAVKIVNYFSLSDQKDILFNDKRYFCFIFRELLENAVNFTSEGVIECGYTHPNEGKIIFYVKDTGLGMTDQEKQIAFEKFNHPLENEYRASMTGIGIGLAICRNLVTKMGGSIWVSSNLGEGTTIYFYLDFDMSIFKDLQNHLVQKQIDLLQRKSICIIDEDLGSQKYISKFLMKYNITSRKMPNASFYEKYIRANHKCDIIFFDYDSGLKDFFYANMDILKERKVTFIIMARTILEEDLTRKLVGYHYFIIYKPLKNEELVNSLKSCLRSSI